MDLQEKHLAVNSTAWGFLSHFHGVEFEVGDLYSMSSLAPTGHKRLLNVLDNDHVLAP
jgi:hypothetical protein